MFKITLEKMNSNYSEVKNEAILEEKTFDIKKEANKFKRSLMEKYNLINHGGYIVNYSDQIELCTNF